MMSFISLFEQKITNFVLAIDLTMVSLTEVYVSSVDVNQ